jgi:hypothetical protein
MASTHPETEPNKMHGYTTLYDQPAEWFAYPSFYMIYFDKRHTTRSVRRASTHRIPVANHNTTTCYVIRPASFADDALLLG